jgi:hypothetical protein|tara:strand:+ start:622 stop:819 length:198 start_codon:yes stop_codon:yes gene_type:complete
MFRMFRNPKTRPVILDERCLPLAPGLQQKLLSALVEIHPEIMEREDIRSLHQQLRELAGEHVGTS